MSTRSASVIVIRNLAKPNSSPFGRPALLDVCATNVAFRHLMSSWHCWKMAAVKVLFCYERKGVAGAEEKLQGSDLFIQVQSFTYFCVICPFFFFLHSFRNLLLCFGKLPILLEPGNFILPLLLFNSLKILVASNLNIRHALDICSIRC